MQFAQLRTRLKPWVLPFSMLMGVVFHEHIGAVAFVAPYLIFAMLFVTYCKVDLRQFRLTRLSWGLIAVQVLAAIAIYFMLRPLDKVVAQGTFICIFCPTATAAPVITAMLGGNLSRLATFSLVSNAAVAILAPILFTAMGAEGVDFFDSAVTIGLRVIPLITLPLIAALLLKRIWPRAHQEVAQRPQISFYIWALSLVITVGCAVSFVMQSPPSTIPQILAMAVTSLLACLMQFYVGRRIGRRCGDTIVGGQALGQKNTVLAIWMALTYLNPLSSVAPAAYVAWQNTINSLQIYLHDRKRK